MKRILTFSIIAFFSFNAYSQIAINNDNSQPDPSAMLDIKSTDSGVLVPRMTSTERNLISNIATGLLVYDTDEKAFMFYDGNGWKKVGDDSDSDPVNEIQTLTMDTKEISISGGNSVEFSPLGKSWEFPQGLEGSPVINFDRNKTYTVPSGKTLYITSILSNVITPDTMGVGSSGIVFIDFNNFYHNSFTPSYPIIPSETNIKGSFTGVLVDNSPNITPVIFFWEEGTNNSFTVPANKKLIIKSGLSSNPVFVFNINGFGIGGFYNDDSRRNILIIPSNATISSFTNIAAFPINFFDLNVLFTGYLLE